MGTVKITHTMVCPLCGVENFTRVHRSFWMRWFHRSRRYRCRHCRSEILLLARGPARSDSTPGEA